MMSVGVVGEQDLFVHVQPGLGGREQVHGAAGGRHFGHGIGPRRVVGENDAAVRTATRGLIQGGHHGAVFEFLAGDIDAVGGLVDALQEAGARCRRPDEVGLRR